MFFGNETCEFDCRGHLSLKNRVDLILDLLEREPSVFGVVIAPDPEILGPKGARQEMSDPWDLME